MAFTEKLATRKPRTAAEHYDAWYDGLPDEEQAAVTQMLQDTKRSNGELKNIIETDEDYPAPKFGMTAFREWKASV